MRVSVRSDRRARYGLWGLHGVGDLPQGYRSRWPSYHEMGRRPGSSWHAGGAAWLCPSGCDVSARGLIDMNTLGRRSPCRHASIRSSTSRQRSASRGHRLPRLVHHAGWSHAAALRSCGAPVDPGCASSRAGVRLQFSSRCRRHLHICPRRAVIGSIGCGPVSGGPWRPRGRGGLLSTANRNYKAAWLAASNIYLGSPLVAAVAALTVSSTTRARPLGVRQRARRPRRRAAAPSAAIARGVLPSGDRLEGSSRAAPCTSRCKLRGGRWKDHESETSAARVGIPRYLDTDQSCRQVPPAHCRSTSTELHGLRRADRSSRRMQPGDILVGGENSAAARRASTPWRRWRLGSAGSREELRPHLLPHCSTSDPRLDPQTPRAREVRRTSRSTRLREFAHASRRCSSPSRRRSRADPGPVECSVSGCARDFPSVDG